MSVLMVAVVAVAAGLFVRRWWVLAVPPAMAAGALLVMAMPGNSINPDNPLAFLFISLELFLAAGILTARRLHPTTSN
jgi:hypothetical protein